jgi:hypothetical protein
MLKMLKLIHYLFNRNNRKISIKKSYKKHYITKIINFKLENKIYFRMIDYWAIDEENNFFVDCKRDKTDNGITKRFYITDDIVINQIVNSNKNLITLDHDLNRVYSIQYK